MLSSNALTPFAFEDALVRIHLDEAGQPWFVARDVCAVLELGNSREAIRNLDDDEKADVRITDISSNGVTQARTVNTVSESGLYSLVFRSRKEAARRFRKWVTAEVLPALRKSGSYSLNPAGAKPPQGVPELLPALPQEALALRPAVRGRLWDAALQTARLDNAGSDAAVEWFCELCRMMAAQRPGTSEEVAEYFAQRCINAPGRTVRAHVLYRDYCRWRGQGRTMSQRAFGEGMAAHARRKKSNGVHYCDITLRGEGKRK